MGTRCGPDSPEEEEGKGMGTEHGTKQPPRQRFREPRVCDSARTCHPLCVGVPVNTKVQSNPNTGKRENSPFLQLSLCAVCVHAHVHGSFIHPEFSLAPR